MRSGGEIGRIKILSLGLDDEMVWAAGIFRRFQWAWEFTDPQASRRGVGQGVYMQGKKHTEARIWYCQSGVCPGPPPDDPFPLPTQGQPPHWLTPPQAKPVLATATDNQQGSWLALAIPFLFHLVGGWTLLAESYGEEKLIPPTSGTD